MFIVRSIHCILTRAVSTPNSDGANPTERSFKVRSHVAHSRPSGLLIQGPVNCFVTKRYYGICPVLTLLRYKEGFCSSLTDPNSKMAFFFLAMFDRNQFLSCPNLYHSHPRKHPLWLLWMRTRIFATSQPQCKECFLNMFISFCQQEHHLQRAICTGLIIPTPEVCDVQDLEFYERCYPADYKMPKQHIHMQRE